ncbi:hypothetical protein [Lysobacter terrae]
MQTRVTVMKALSTVFALSVLAISLGLHPSPAAGDIQRCETEDGERIYTDRACALFAATAAPMSGELLGRIAHEEAQSLAAAIEQGAAIEVDLPTEFGRRPVASGCARTPTQLTKDLQGSFALGNVNRVAESYHWVGLDNAHGQRILDRLEHMGQKPLTDSRYYAAQIFAADDANAWLASTGALGSGGVMQLVFGDGSSSSVTDFHVVRYAGCYFVKF